MRNHDLDCQGFQVPVREGQKLIELWRERVLDGCEFERARRVGNRAGM